MAIDESTRSARGADDVELGIARHNPVVYHVCAPQAQEAAGLAFVIPSLGDDPLAEPMRALRRHLAEAHGLIAVSVEYHGFRSRIEDGARFDLSEGEMASLRGICAGHGIALLDGERMLGALAKLPRPYEFELKVVPANGEYQDLGVMQALDHLAVLHDLAQDPQCRFDTANTVALGARYGGYLAHLVAKFAPNTIRAVFDDSAPTSAPASYLFGANADDGAPYYYHLGQSRIFPLIATHWDAKNFSPGRRAIRDLADARQVATMGEMASRRCQYRIASGAAAGSPAQARKRAQAQLLAARGFDAQLVEVEGDDAARMRGLFDAGYIDLARLPGATDSALGSGIAYLCDDLLYSFDYTRLGCTPFVVAIERERRLRFY